MRSNRKASILILAGILLAGVVAVIPARAAQSSKSAAVIDSRITADSPPYRIEWNGTSGTFVRKAFGQDPELRQPISFLHTDAGPTGFAKYLVWFLARDKQSFSLLWCYLNDSGGAFDCWLYQYPSNQLTSLHFTGDYRFAAPAESPPATAMPDLKLPDPPPYSGPAFTYRNWTKVVGALPKVDLRSPRRNGAPLDTSPVLKSVSQLIVRPLHEVEVGSANGWREGGWNELHALAYDAAQDPYYLILYSNTPNGYVVDLRQARIYAANFGDKVTFEGATSSGPLGNPLDLTPETKVHRYDRHEIVLSTAEKTANPYLDVQVGIEFHGPDAKSILVPGFWDGGGTFRVRFAPMLNGVWTWTSHSQTGDLDGRTGTFECIGEAPGVKGFVNVQPVHRDTHHFSYSDGEPFLPALLREPLPAYTSLSTGSKASDAPGPRVQLTGLDAAPVQDDTSSFIAFQRFIAVAAQKGFNRLVGGTILGPAAAGLVRANDGGPAFIGGSLDQINPLFFQSMDRRIAYCNGRGVVPDIGVGTLDDALFTQYEPMALYRFWAYVLARYDSFDVQWTLFEPGAGPISQTTRKAAEQFAELTRQVDPCHHPITSVALNAGAAPVAASAESTPGSQRRSGGGAMAAGSSAPRRVVPADLPWQDLITVEGGDIGTLPYYGWIQKPLVILERPLVGQETALSPDVTRHRMWEARMRGAYWSPANVNSADPNALNSVELKWAGHCADLFRHTRYYRLAPRPEMLGGPSESSADRKRRKKAEAAEARLKPPPPVDDAALDLDPFDTDPFDALPPAPVPKPTPMFVLADPAREYVVYFEEGGSLLLDLLEATGKVDTTWFNPRTGEYSTTKQIMGGAYTSFTAPDANDWVLYVSRL